MMIHKNDGSPQICLFWAKHVPGGCSSGGLLRHSLGQHNEIECFLNILTSVLSAFRAEMSMEFRSPKISDVCIVQLVVPLCPFVSA